MKDLKQRALRGGFAKVCAQAANFSLRLGSLVILARLLDPKDFGLVAMVTALTGMLNLFRDFGLSTATVQRTDITEGQISTLFWINLLVGAALTCLVLAGAPLVARFYHEPRLLWVTMALSAGFLFNAAGVQHSALLQRKMRFTTLAAIDTISLVANAAVGIGMAMAGFGYWALVGMTVATPLVYSVLVWLAAAWVPGLPRRGTGVGAMLRFGGTVTLNTFVVYVAYNLEKVLLGRFWGADALGIYGRAYQLINIPTDTLTTAVGDVALAGLSRVKEDGHRLRSFFLKGYSLVVTLTLPTTIACALFADDVIFVVLGPKWSEVAPIFRFLAPTILIYAMINPMWWLLVSLGLVGRSLKIALVLAPLVMASYVVGLPYGPKGIALAYSTVLTLWVIPHIAWCVRGTAVSLRDILWAIGRPLLAAAIAAVLAGAVLVFWPVPLSHLARLLLGGPLLLIAYVALLFYGMGQKAFYLDVLYDLAKRPARDKSVASV